MFLNKLAVLLSIAVGLEAFPTGGGFQAAGVLETNGVPPLISLDKGGNFGVNFGGYHASAGLGGLLSGGGGGGGLHASAGTPYGQRAAAGLGGTIGGGGGLFAGATGGGFGSGGGGFTSGGGGFTSGGGGFSSGGGGGFVSGGGGFEGGAKIKGGSQEVVVAETNVKGPAQVQRTIIEKTVIPNYVEKKVQETHYVEKTIRVPETIEKTIRVPVAPTVIEKHIQVPTKKVHLEAVQPAGAGFRAGLNVGFKATPVVRVVEQKPPAVVSVAKYSSTGGAIGESASGGFSAGGGFAGSAGTAGGGYAGGGHSAAGGGYAYKANSNLFNDIFNIPISTLGAVSNLVSGILGGIGGGGGGGASVHAGGAVGVGKQYGY